MAGGWSARIVGMPLPALLPIRRLKRRPHPSRHSPVFARRATRDGGGSAISGETLPLLRLRPRPTRLLPRRPPHLAPHLAMTDAFVTNGVTPRQPLLLRAATGTWIAAMTGGVWATNGAMLRRLLPHRRRLGGTRHGRNRPGAARSAPAPGSAASLTRNCSSAGTISATAALATWVVVSGNSRSTGR